MNFPGWLSNFKTLRSLASLVTGYIVVVLGSRRLIACEPHGTSVMVPSSPRKPAGSGYGGYVANAHWLTLEFPNKFIAVESWDHMKILISKKPTHKNIGTVVVGVTDFSREAIAAVVNTKGWSTTLFGVEASPDDIMIVNSAVVEAYKGTIKTRQLEYEQSIAADGVESARKRLRGDDEDAHSGVVVKDDGLPGADGDGNTGLASPAFSPAEATGWGDEDSDDAPLLPQGAPPAPMSDSAPDYADSETLANTTLQVDKHEKLLSELSKKVNVMNDYLRVIQRHAFQMDAVLIFNVKFDTTNIDKITNKMQSIFSDVGLLAEGENIKKVYLEPHGPHLAVKVTFKNCEAAMYTTTQSARFSPQYWHQKDGGAAIIQKMTIMRKNVFKVDKSAFSGGYMYVQPAPNRRNAMDGGARAAASAASAASSASW